MKKSSVFAMRQKKRCSFCTDKKRWRDCRKRSDKSCPTPHSAPFLALFRVAGRQKDALAGNGVLEQRHEPGEHNADHDLQQVNQPPGPLITNGAATGMWYTIKVRLAKSRPVPWLTVHGTDTMANAPSLSMPSANRTILTDRSRSGQHAALSF